MRWLWQYGARWVGSQLWSEAKRAATDHVAPDPNNPHDPAADDPDSPPDPDAAVPRETVMAVACESKRLFDAVADQVSRARHIEGDRFSLCKGLLGGRSVVVARPLRESPNHLQLVTALIDGHRPQFILSAGEATSLAEHVRPGSIVVASRVVGVHGQSLRLQSTKPPLAECYSGVVAYRGSESSAVLDTENPLLSEDQWSEPIARACQQAGVAMMAASVVFEPTAAQRSREVASLKGQSSLAGRAGVLTGMLWKKRSGLRDLWNEQEAAWEATTRLAKLAQLLASSAKP